MKGNNMPTDTILGGFARNWWGLLLRGIIAIVFGIMAFAWPGITLISLAMLYGAFALIDGVLSIMFGIGSRAWALVLFGLLGIAAGIFTLFLPWTTAVALLYMIGGWAVVRGVFEIVTAIQLRHEITNEWSLGFAGLMSVVVGLMFLVRPGAGALALTWLIGAYAIVAGVLLITLALRVRGLHERLDKLSHAA
jgi:uncharacterized membrane protein HdeD (DUF308 family)